MTTPTLPAASPEQVGLSAARLARLSAVLRERVDQGHLPGIVALIGRRDRVAYFEAFGKRDPASGAAMPLDAIFRIYSMTKPIVSVAIMMLMEEGRLLLNQPVSAFLPEFAQMDVAEIVDGKIERRRARNAMTVQDLLRHTSGLTYEFRGAGPVHKAYMDAKIYRRSQDNADQAAMLAGLPLLHEPGTVWEYSRSTDVLGRLVEVVSGRTLGAFLSERILEPLGMADAGFHVPAEKQDRLAQGFAKDPDTGEDVMLLDVREPARFESGGGGMVASTMDYARFVQMLANGGAMRGVRLLSRKTVALMTADHLGPIKGSADLLPPGYGFGLGFAVRTHAGIATTPGSVGQYYWSGAAGTTFWVDPAEQLFAILMIQAPGPREHYRNLFRDLVYAAIEE
ncbi:MAG: beta-lactamase family protein [Proteobacteria bacterium]|nr:beta-lactamase family protein [Pseudomonadota bacterium]